MIKWCSFSSPSFPIHSHPSNTPQPFKHIYPPPHTHPTHKNTPTSPPQSSIISWSPCFGFKTYSQLQLILSVRFNQIRNKLPRHNLINRWRGWVALITYLIVTSSIFYKDDFGRVWFEYFVQQPMLWFFSWTHIDNTHIWRPKEYIVVTYIPQPTCMTIFNELINLHKVFFFFVLPTLTSFHSWCEILQSRIKSTSFVEIGRCTNYLQKLCQKESVTSRVDFFVIHNKSRVQIFRIDE